MTVQILAVAQGIESLRLRSLLLIAFVLALFVLALVVLLIARRSQTGAAKQIGATDDQSADADWLDSARSSASVPAATSNWQAAMLHGEQTPPAAAFAPTARLSPAPAAAAGPSDDWWSAGADGTD
jgi:hypothetical protein